MNNVEDVYGNIYEDISTPGNPYAKYIRVKIMNNKCHGDHFVANGKRYYYCLMDGTIVRANKLLNGFNCPNCHRMIDGNSEPYQAEVRTKTQIKVPDSVILNEWRDLE